MVKKILSILLWVATAAAIVLLFIYARRNYLDTPLQRIQLTFEADSGFISKTSLHDEIAALCKGKNIGSLNMLAIQRHLNDNPWIARSASHVDLDGTLSISYKEYEPQLRVFGNNGRSVYLTQERMVLPPSHGYTPYVLIASGKFDINNDTNAYPLIDTLDSHITLISALAWWEAIKDNAFINNSVGQLYCNNRNEFELTVKGIEARVIVGDTSLAADKLHRLELFMKQRTDSHEVKTMKIINLSYKNQIVCTKR